ncbi:MAG: 4Fe-4S ferredoxin [Candidatus Gerdarchaeota archaeon]|nr:MAG: 4Fe-4S ferredoxin [Candidatus Gerdarchaeota archaeon]
METSDVYFYDNCNNLKAGVNKFLKKIAEEIGETELVGIKVHFGERDNDTHVSASLLQDIPKFFKKPVFIECNVLYRGRRMRKEDHIQQAKEHGFGFIDIDILDGEMGEDYMEVELETKNTKKAKLGRGLKKYEKLISIAHFKGHIVAGFGGALKNVGMGLGSRGGKLDMHAGVSPKIDIENCKACGSCAEQCPADAIKVKDYAIIDKETCIGCAQCIAVCPEEVIKIPWGVRPQNEFLEKIAEYTLACTINRVWWYINFLTDITMKCDCVGTKQEPFMEDIGILFSKDPIAIDQASIDLIKQKFGKDPFAKYNKNSQEILKYGEKIGLGVRKYQLIKVE